MQRCCMHQRSWRNLARNPRGRCQCCEWVASSSLAIVSGARELSGRVAVARVTARAIESCLGCRWLPATGELKQQAWDLLPVRHLKIQFLHETCSPA
ncbi:hypothetical protein IG631_09477 [Alternaria alternata]|nr:hypothetical protein IG631_09477 [Alternaria alternata]